MREIFDNFLHLRALNVEPVVVWVLAGIYAIILMITLVSALMGSRGWLFKLGWSLAVLALPFVGMALYALRCLWMADRSLFNQLGFTIKRPANWDTTEPLNLKVKSK